MNTKVGLWGGLELCSHCAKNVFLIMTTTYYPFLAVSLKMRITPPQAFSTTMLLSKWFVQAQHSPLLVRILAVLP